MAPPEWNFGHVAGICDVSFVGSGDDALLVTCGADNAVTVRNPETAEIEESFTEEHDDAVNVLAVSPDGAKFATGSDDNSVKLFNFAGASREFESNVVRFTLPVRALAWSADGAFLAAGGEDNAVKVVKMDDKSVALDLSTRSKCVKSLTFDPKGDFLTAVDDAGVLTVWALKAIAAGDDDDADMSDDGDDDAKNASTEAGEIVLSATVAPVTEPDSCEVNRACWRPDGAVLAVPGREHDVTFFARGTWTELENHRLIAEDGSEGKGHGENVVLAQWSPNGKYLLTSAKDHTVCVWDVKEKKVINFLKHESTVCGACWRQTGNAVALVDGDGQWTLWKNPVPPSGFTGPTVQVDAAELNFFQTEEPLAPLAGAVDGEMDGDDIIASEDEEGMGDMDEETYYSELERRKRMKKKLAKGGQGATVAAAPTPQPAFQVGSVPAKATGDDAGNDANGPSRRFLCYNMIGSVVSTGEPGGDFNSVEMAFHDTSRGGRIPTITDYHGYSIGCLGERGCALASPAKQSGGSSVLFYRPYESWTHKSDWSVTLPVGEDAVSVATGKDWVAALTSGRMLRVFSHAGAQRQMVQLDGAPVTAAGKGDSLVVAWHTSAPALVPDAADPKTLQVEQRIEFAEYDMANGGKVLSKGKIPMPPGATLTWLGHVEDGNGAIAFGASDGCVRVRTSEFGGSWTPVFRSMDARQQEGEHHWTVAASVAESALYCVVCGNANGPAVHPRPVLTPLPLGMPVALPDTSSGDLEDAAARAQLSVALAAAAAAGDTAGFRDDVDPAGAAQDALRAAQTEADKSLLRLFHAACKGERPARAADVAAALNLTTSMHGALKLANAMSQNVLAERVTNLIEASMAAAAAAAEVEAARAYGGSIEMDTPGQAPQQHYSQPAAYVAPSQATQPEKDSNPLGRRKSVTPATDENAEAPKVGAKVKAGYEANAAPAKKGRVANPFARAR